ncbi:hypothetical protein BDD12DRAFT_435944 [Trichophaea hybrida]|nr:hypothetical protein BDD12DRAFT_435944 [Trichophaea hybrida]
MSFGFSVGDFIAAIQLATDLWTTCFSEVSGAKIAYIRYGEQVKGLGSSLQNLMQILNDHEKNLQRRRGQKLKVDSMDLDALAEIIGDFMGTLRRTETLLNKYSVFRRDGRGFVTKIRWSIDAEDEVHRLTQDCAFHIAKIQFVTEPLKMKLLLDLGDQIEGVQNVLMGKLEQLEDLIRQSQGLPPPPEITGSAPPYPGIHASNVHALTSRRLEEKFEETLHYHPRFRSIDPEVPIQDYTEAAAWWIDNGTGQFSKQKIYGSQLVPADLYLNFLKAAWLLKRCEKSAIYRRLDKNSLWCEYICGLLESISTEIKSFSERELSIPDEDSLLRLPDDCFLVWLNKPEKEVVLGIRDERPGEEKILQLTLETTLDPERFTRELLVFRKGEETLRLCDTTENFENGSRSSEEFVVNCVETQLIAVYIAGYNPRAPVLNVLMRNRLQNREYSFKAPRDLHDFQRAIVGAQVMFDQYARISRNHLRSTHRHWTARKQRADPNVA